MNTNIIYDKIINKESNFGNEPQMSLKKITRLVYLCQVLAFFFGITAIIGVILNYLNRSEVKNSCQNPIVYGKSGLFGLG